MSGNALSSNASFVRKIGYIGAIVALLIPLAILGQPDSMRRTGKNFTKKSGGELARMRERLELSPAKLGDIDPASATMRLATSGMRGVAVTLLMNKAEEYKKKKEWDNLAATLKQVSLLLPNFIAVWEHQAWNMSYNVSVEFDDYKQRYHWVKKGIDFLIEGTEYNRNEPRLLWYVGWVIGQKLGRSDERVQFRKLYRDDTEFHEIVQRRQIDIDAARGADGKPDNWLTGRLWYLKGQQAVDEGRPLRGKSPVIFHSSPVMSRINFASDLEKEGDFDQERAVSEWGEASREWRLFGERSLPTSAGFTMHLNELEELEEKETEADARLDALAPGVREKLREQRQAKLVPDAVKALAVPADQRTATQRMQAEQAEEYLRVPAKEVADRAPAENRAKAAAIIRELTAAADRIRSIRTSRTVVNFEYWRDRCLAESDERCARARKLIYYGNQAYRKPDLEEAKKNYEEAWTNFAAIYEAFPRLAEDADTDDVVDAIETYIRVLEQLDLRDESGGVLPPDFPLSTILLRKDKGNLLKFRKATPEEIEAKKAREAKTTSESPKAEAKQESNGEQPNDASKKE